MVKCKVRQVKMSWITREARFELDIAKRLIKAGTAEKRETVVCACYGGSISRFRAYREEG